MKKLMILIFISLVTSTVAMANHGKGLGNKMDNVVAGSPPGLQGKGMPHGLSKQGKTPAGWSHGNKQGWDNDKIFWKKNWDKFFWWDED